MPRFRDSQRGQWPHRHTLDVLLQLLQSAVCVWPGAGTRVTCSVCSASRRKSPSSRPAAQGGAAKAILSRRGLRALAQQDRWGQERAGLPTPEVGPSHTGSQSAATASTPWASLPPHLLPLHPPTCTLQTPQNCSHWPLGLEEQPPTLETQTQRFLLCEVSSSQPRLAHLLSHCIYGRHYYSIEDTILQFSLYVWHLNEGLKGGQCLIHLLLDRSLTHRITQPMRTGWEGNPFLSRSHPQKGPGGECANR